MNNFTPNEYNILTQILGYSENRLKEFLYKYLIDKGYENVEMNEVSIMAKGEIPIALVAHLDTVFQKPGKQCNVIWDREKGIMINPIDGAGFDDRAGVMAILQIIASGLRPHIIFTCGEETGAAGASYVAAQKPFEDLRYIIELDRCGSNDCVFYNCDNKEFIDFIEAYGFVEAYGTFSDISIICPAWEIAGVNLSIGYMDEHSKIERLYTKYYKSTVKRVIKMLMTPPEHSYEYIEFHFPTQYKYNYLCSECGKEININELIPVNTKDGTRPICMDCSVKMDVGWCVSCGEAYTGMGKNTLCRKCRKIKYE